MRAVQCAILLLPDENREVLQTLLYFLSDVATKKDENQMPASNLAVCFAPSLFHLHLNLHKSPSTFSRISRRRSFDLKKSIPIPDEHTLSESVAAHNCFTFMIKECKNLFKIPSEMMTQCRLTVMEQTEDILFSEFGYNPLDNLPALSEHVDRKLARDYMHNWVKDANSPIANNIHTSLRCEDDGIPLKLFRTKFSVSCAPSDVLNFILNGRRYWDLDLIEFRKIVDVDETSDIIQYVSASMSPHPHRDYCLYRAWRYHKNGKCALYTTSTRHQQVKHFTLI